MGPGEQDSLVHYQRTKDAASLRTFLSKFKLRSRQCRDSCPNLAFRPSVTLRYRVSRQQYEHSTSSRHESNQGLSKFPAVLSGLPPRTTVGNQEDIRGSTRSCQFLKHRCVITSHVRDIRRVPSQPQSERLRFHLRTR